MILYVCVCMCVLCTEPQAALSSQSGNSVTAADVSGDSEMDLGEWFPRLVKILASVSSVQELLNQAAENLDDPDKQVEQAHQGLEH